MKIHTLALIAAMACSSASLSMAQTAQPQRGNDTPPNTDRSMAPPTPPAHPSTMSPGDAGGMTGKSMNSKSEAMQACKNLSSADERKSCMKREKKSSGSGKAGSEENRGSGYPQPDSKP